MAVERTDEGQIVAEARGGVDVYDPTTGQVRSSSTDDIACWFVDTSYNGESFFVREAYFTGADDPLQGPQAGAPGGHRRGGLGDAVSDS